MGPCIPLRVISAACAIFVLRNEKKIYFLYFTKLTKQIQILLDIFHVMMALDYVGLIELH